jgi:uncharacterized protein (TIGR02001 family)
MKKFLNVVFGAALMGSAMTAAADDIAGNVTLATDYRFRGISQDHGNFSPAIQGGFDWSMEGFYVGTWASNVNFTEAAIETDVYGGYRGKFNEDVEYDVGILYYGYPQDGSQHLAYTEYYASVSTMGAKVGVNYSDNYFGGSGGFFYPYINYSHDLPEGFSISAHFGYNSFDHKQDGNPFGNGPLALGGKDNYSDWSVGISKDLLGVTWALTYVDTNLDDDQECFGDKDLCAATAVFSLSKSL